MTFLKKSSVTDSEIQFQRLEMKVNALMAICVVQTVMLAVLLFAEMFIPSTFTVLVIIVILGFVGYLFRKQLPGIFSSIAGNVFRFVTKQTSQQSSKPTESSESNDLKFK